MLNFDIAANGARRFSSHASMFSVLEKQSSWRVIEQQLVSIIELIHA
jgi:hypothetical protein